MTGAIARRYASAQIKKHGLLTVTRPSTGAEQSLYCLSLRDTVAQDKLMSEGGQNAANAQPRIFVFEWSADVQEEDQVAWQGETYILGKVQPTPLYGVIIKKTAYGNRG